MTRQTEYLSYAYGAGCDAHSYPQKHAPKTAAAQLLQHIQYRICLVLYNLYLLLVLMRMAREGNHPPTYEVAAYDDRE